jgi:hypothetical protein
MIINEMLELIIVLLLMITLGLFIYIYKYMGKEKPKIGIKRDNLVNYYKDYFNLKLYWTSKGFILMGSILLIAIVIMELLF